MSTKRPRKPAAESTNGVPVAETKEQKLLRLAAARVKKACNSIRLVGNLAAYKPTDPQIDKIMEALGGQCASVEARMRGTRRETIHFTLQ